LNGFGLAQNHAQHRAVDSAVFSEYGDGPNVAGLLTKTIDPTFPLLMSRRVPAQIVMDHSIEE
jgi:hypothetical protein